MKAELLFDARAYLGEGPSWDDTTQTLYWVDIMGKRLYAGTEVLKEWDDVIGCAVPTSNGRVAVGTRAGVAEFDPATGRTRVLTTFTEEPANNRLNDGKCDPSGRLLVGSMDRENERDPTGTLYSYDGVKTTSLLSGLIISNGLAWSPDQKTLYHIDTPTREVRAYDYDVATGDIANGRTVITVRESLGWPDGMTSDAQGNLWIALWGGASVTRWNPRTGACLDQIPLPALNTSSCVFGGPGRNVLYVTSARKGMNEADLRHYPLSGGLFRIDTRVEGSPTWAFRSRE